MKPLRPQVGERAICDYNSRMSEPHALDLEALITNLLIIMSAGLVAGLICRRLHVSLLVGDVAVGAVIGAGGLGLISGHMDELELLAEAGVLFLLFSIGLEFSLKDLAHLSRFILISGSVQMLLVASPTMITLMYCGHKWPRAMLICFSLAMSSTVLVFKALNEYGQAGSPAGRRSVAVLLGQDIAVVPLLLLVPLLSGRELEADPIDIARLVLTTVGIVAGVLLLRHLLRQWMVSFLAGLRSPELIMLFAIVVLSTVAYATHFAGLPPPLGAFAAGLALSGNRLTRQIDALTLPFREVFAAIFFVTLGLLFDYQVLTKYPGLITGSFVALMALKWFAATVAVRLTGLPLRAAAGVGLCLCQVGEFAFVLSFAGLEQSVIAQDDYRAILMVGLVSMLLTPTLIRWGLRLASGVEEGDPQHGALQPPKSADPIAVVIGIGPAGQQVANRLQRQHWRVQLIDLSAVNVHEMAAQGFDTLVGDARDPHVLRQARAHEAGLVLVCVPDDGIALRIVEATRRLNTKAAVLVRCRFIAKRDELLDAGASAVVSEEEELAHALLHALEKLPQTLVD